MLRRLRQSATLTLVVLGLTAPAVAFNPAGRSKKPKPTQKAKPPAGAARPQSSPKPASAQPADGGAKAAAKPDGPNRETLIARYLGIVLSQPGAEFPLERLTELYRERDGNLEKLVAELTARAQVDASSYAALLALAGVYKRDAQPERAVATLQQAMARSLTTPSASWRSRTCSWTAATRARRRLPSSARCRW